MIVVAAASLDIWHGKDFAAELSLLILGAVNPVKDGVAVDPEGQAAEFMVAEFYVLMALSEELQQAAAAGAVEAAGPRSRNGPRARP